MAASATPQGVVTQSPVDFIHVIHSSSQGLFGCPSCATAHAPTMSPSKNSTSALLPRPSIPHMVVRVSIVSKHAYACMQVHMWANPCHPIKHP